MELGYFYKFCFSQEGRWRKVLVHEQTLMRDLYLIIPAVMEFHNTGSLDIAWACNYPGFRGKRVFEVFDKINSQIEIRIPFNEYKASNGNILTVGVLTVVEEKKKVTDLNLGPLCVECDIPNPTLAAALLSKINRGLKEWNFSFSEILCELYTKDQVMNLASNLGIKIPPCFRQEEFAIEVELLLLKNPTILMDIYLHRDMVVLSKMINSVDLAYDWVSTSEEDLLILKYMFCVKEEFDRAATKRFCAPNTMSLLLHNYIREAVDNISFKQLCLVEDCIFRIVNERGSIKAEKAMDILRKQFVLEEDNEQVISILMQRGRVRDKIHTVSYKQEMYLCNNSFENYNIIRDFPELY